MITRAIRRMGIAVAICLCSGSAQATHDPVNLTVSLAPSGGVLLEWAGGLPGFMVFRSVDAATITDAGNELGQTEATAWLDASPTDDLLFYRIAGRANFVLYVESPVVHASLNTPIRIFTAGLTSPPTAVRLIETGTAVPTSLSFSAGPASPNIISALVPAGLASGPWDVEVTASDGCVGLLPSGLSVVDSSSLLLDSVEPTTQYSGTGGTLTIHVTPPPGLLATPRVFLTPSGGPGAAVRLQAETFLDAATMSAIVPAGLIPATYDVVVINPDGLSGLLLSGLTVVATAPPAIDSVIPVTLLSSGPTEVVLSGQNFEIGGASANLECHHPLSGFSSAPGTIVDNSSTDELVALLPGDLMNTGSVCSVTVTNLTDGATASYSTLSIASPSSSVASWNSTSSMMEARRWPAAVLQHADDGSRVLHAIGGDNGSIAGAKTSVESSRLGPLGNLGIWSAQSLPLPAARTAAGAVTVGRFLYLLGGHDGSSAQDTVYRAELLRSDAAPPFDSVELGLGGSGAGFAAGLYYYKLSVVYGPTDPSNPDGESLPGEPLAVWVPTDPSLEVRLSWSSVPGADSYRVYRTPVSGLLPDDVELLADVSGTSFIDVGAASLGTTPLAPGSLSAWHTLTGSSLNMTRDSHAVAVAPDPADPDAMIIYVIAGRGPGGFELGSYEYAKVTILPDGSQTLGMWTMGSMLLNVARAELAASVATHQLAGNVPAGTTYLYLIGGRQGGTVLRDVESAEVGPGGELGTPSVESQPLRHSGTASFIGSNSTVLIFGGRLGLADARGQSASISQFSPPDLANWNTDISLSAARALSGYAQNDVLLFVVGGADESGLPLNTVELGIR